MKAVTASHTGCMFGKTLWVNKDTELDNVVKLLARFPTLHSVYDAISTNLTMFMAK